MKKFFVLMALMLTSFYAYAFEFDGIDLNTNYSDVAREISKRGYSYDSDRNCLKGICQGTEIYLSINYVDVKKAGMVGQLIVEIPNQSAEAFANVTTLLNVIYHQVSKDGGSVVYQADADGTRILVSQKGSSIVLTYNTPFYKKK